MLLRVIYIFEYIATAVDINCLLKKELWVLFVCFSGVLTTYVPGITRGVTVPFSPFCRHDYSVSHTYSLQLCQFSFIAFDFF